MTVQEARSEVQRGAQGRLVIPVTLRKALKLQPGDRLVARRVGDGLMLERREAIEQRLQARFAHIPDLEHLADELVAEGRAEARREVGP